MISRSALGALTLTLALPAVLGTPAHALGASAQGQTRVVPVAAAPALTADGAPANEHLVNVETEGDQYFPAVATSSRGIRLVAWTDTSELVGHDHDHTHTATAETEPAPATRVKARLLDRSGRPVGEEIRIDAEPAGNQMYPAVTALDNGDFAVSWLRTTAPKAQEVRAIRVGADGALRGAPQVISETTTPVQFAPSMAALPGGGAVVAWTGKGAGETTAEAEAWDAHARVLTADLTPSGSQLVLNRTTASRQTRPSVARTKEGFVAAWTDESKTVDTASTGIRGALFDATGSPVGPEQQLNTVAPGTQARPSLAPLRNGSIAVAWEVSGATPPPDGAGTAAMVRVLDATLAQGAPEQVMSTITAGNQQKPRLAALANGGFAAVWEDGSKSADDPNYLSVRGRWFAPDGAPVGKDVLVNTSTVADQQQPAVTVGGDNRPVVVWTDGSASSGDDELTAVRSGLLLDPAAVVPLSPSRILDSRHGIGMPQARAAKLRAQTTSRVPVLGRGGVPAKGVRAVVVNVTTTGSTAAGWLTTWGAGPRPTASTLNHAAGQTISNQAVVPVADDGTISLYGSATADVIVDVTGYLPTEPTIAPVGPTRLLDTRATRVRLAAGASVDVPVLGRAGVPAAGVEAVALNVTAVGSTQAGYLTAYPAGAKRPATSTVNVAAGGTAAALALVPVDATGRVRITSTSATDVVVDISAYAPKGSELGWPTAGRVLDTRSTGRVTAGREVALKVASTNGVPADARAVQLNVTATGAFDRGAVTVWPGGQPRPVASVANVARGGTSAGPVLVPVGADGTVRLSASTATHLVVDVQGFTTR